MEIPKFLRRKPTKTYEEQVQDVTLSFSEHGVKFVKDTQLWTFLGIDEEDAGMLAVYAGRKFLQKCLELSPRTSPQYDHYANTLAFYEKGVAETVELEEDPKRRALFSTLNNATNDLFTRMFQKDGRITSTPDGMDSEDLLAWGQRWSERIYNTFGNAKN